MAYPRPSLPRLAVYRVALMAMVIFALTGLTPSLLRAQDADAVVWDRYDVTIEVQEDGSMHVTEYQEISFNGRFSEGFANIPLSRIEELTNVEVAVSGEGSSSAVPAERLRPARYSGEEGTYTAYQQAGEIVIEYGFDPTSSFQSDTRIVQIEYDVEGAIRVYEDLEPSNQQVWWYPITRDVTDIAPVRESTATIVLPEPVDAAEIVAFPDNPTVSGSTYTWERSDLGAGDEFEISLQFPPITSATVPEWQERDDALRQEREEAQERSDWAGVLLLVAGLIASVAVGVLLLVTWFTKGRDPQVGLVAEYIPEPPDDIGPGAAGVLVDETFHSRDVVATVLDLARRGVFTMEPSEGPGMTTTHTLISKEHGETLRPYEKDVMTVIFDSENPKPGTKVGMPQVAGALASRNASIAEGFYRELVEHGYFRDSPERTRNRARDLQGDPDPDRGRSHHHRPFGRSMVQLRIFPDRDRDRAHDRVRWARQCDAAKDDGRRGVDGQVASVPGLSAGHREA